MQRYLPTVTYVVGAALGYALGFRRGTMIEQWINATERIRDAFYPHDCIYKREAALLREEAHEHRIVHAGLLVTGIVSGMIVLAIIAAIVGSLA